MRAMRESRVITMNSRREHRSMQSATQTSGRCRNQRVTPCAAFTRIEAFFTLLGLALLLTTALPLLGNSKLRSDRLICGNNLRRIGVAFHVWSDSHEDKIPWLVPVANGGTAESTLMNNAWFNYLAVSNELGNPALLGCPSDNVKLATRWDLGDGGFSNPGYRNNSLSYLVGCHGDMTLPFSVLSADRNIIPDNVNAGCSIGFRTVIQIAPRSGTVTGWVSTNVHWGTGNLLLTGGNVVETGTAQLRKMLSDANPDNGSEHYLLPR